MLKKSNNILWMIFFILITSCFTVPKPVTTKATGICAGKIDFKTNRTYWSLREGFYNDTITVIARSKDQKKTFTARSKNGVYFFYNLPAGEYSLWKWRKEISANSTITIFLTSDFENINFTIIPDTVTTLQTISVVTTIPKDFSYNVIYNVVLKNENQNELQSALFAKDTNGFYKNYNWIKAVEKTEEVIPVQSSSEVAVSYLQQSDNDFNSIESLFNTNEYSLAFMLFHRMLENLLKSVIINKTAENSIKSSQLKDLFQEAHIELSANDKMLLFDITSLNEKIKNDNPDDNLTSLLNKQYTEKYYLQIKQLREKIRTIE